MSSDDEWLPNSDPMDIDHDTTQAAKPPPAPKLTRSDLRRRPGSPIHRPTKYIKVGADQTRVAAELGTSDPSNQPATVINPTVKLEKPVLASTKQTLNLNRFLEAVNNGLSVMPDSDRGALVHVCDLGPYEERNFQLVNTPQLYTIRRSTGPIKVWRILIKDKSNARSLVLQPFASLQQAGTAADCCIEEKICTNQEDATRLGTIVCDVMNRVPHDLPTGEMWYRGARGYLMLRWKPYFDFRSLNKLCMDQSFGKGYYSYGFDVFEHESTENSKSLRASAKLFVRTPHVSAPSRTTFCSLTQRPEDLDVQAVDAFLASNLPSGFWSGGLREGTSVHTPSSDSACAALLGYFLYATMASSDTTLQAWMYEQGIRALAQGRGLLNAIQAMMVAADMVDLHLVTAEDVIPNYCGCLEKNRSATEHVCMGCGGVRLCSEMGQDEESIRILCKGCFARSTTLRSVRYRSINYTVKILVGDAHKHDRRPGAGNWSKETMLDKLGRQIIDDETWHDADNGTHHVADATYKNMTLVGPNEDTLISTKRNTRPFIERLTTHTSSPPSYLKVAKFARGKDPNYAADYLADKRHRAISGVYDPKNPHYRKVEHTFSTKASLMKIYPPPSEFNPTTWNSVVIAILTKNVDDIEASEKFNPHHLVIPRCPDGSPWFFREDLMFVDDFEDDREDDRMDDHKDGLKPGWQYLWEEFRARSYILQYYCNKDHETIENPARLFLQAVVQWLETGGKCPIFGFQFVQ
ncbi:hypothetical protein KCU67_g1790, partial [Aureobasidium melanogenum]